MECQEKRMELFKLATMATLKTKSPADAGFGEALWENYQLISASLEDLEKKLKEQNKKSGRGSSAVFAN